MSLEESTAKAKDAAQRALKINPNLAEAHNSLAHIALHEWKWETAEEGFREALELDRVMFWLTIGMLSALTALGKSNEAVDQMKKARELDPLSTELMQILGWLILLREGMMRRSCRNKKPWS